MDTGKKFHHPSPREGANILSIMFYFWTFDIFCKGYKRDLKLEDMYSALKQHESGYLGDKLAKNWEKVQNALKETNRKEPSFLKTLFLTFGWEYVMYGVIFALFDISVRTAMPIFLGNLIKYFTPGSNISKENAYLYAGGIIITTGLSILVMHPYVMANLHLGMKVRVACCSLMYRKVLQLSRYSLGSTTVGHIVNLMSNDVNRFDYSLYYAHYIWIAPLQTLVITVILWFKLGMSALVGVAAMLLTIPLQSWMGQATSGLRSKVAVLTDERVKLMNEIIMGIQVIKMYTWEIPFANLVSSARKAEMKQVRFSSYLKGVYSSLILFTSRTAVYTTLLAYTLFGHEITAEKVFVLTSYYSIVCFTMAMNFPQAIALIAETRVSIKRIQKFLSYQEIDAFHRNSELTHSKELTVIDASAKWSSNVTENTLTKINVSVKPGMLVAVIGPVGAGKTSLLQAILGELPLASGSIKVDGKISYSCQEPWTFSGTIRQNILFGLEYDRKRYSRVVEVCALHQDFKQFPYGDSTIVGERGVSLSGGQRARLTLARAVYNDADFYLLDDPLSAVDSHVGRHLFDECIAGYLFNKTRILVTHQLQYLKKVDEIIILNNGEIEAKGNYEELQKTGLDFAMLLKHDEENPQKHGTKGGLGNSPSKQTSRQASPTKAPPEAESNLLAELLDRMKQLQEDQSGVRKTISPWESTLDDHAKLIEKRSRTNSDSVDADEMEERQKVEESRSLGSVSSSVYRKYFAAGGHPCVIIILFFLFLMAQLLASSCDYWVAFWTNMEELWYIDLLQSNSWGISTSEPKFTVTNPIPEVSATFAKNNSHPDDEPLYLEFNTKNCMYIYSALIFLTIIITLGRSFLFFSICMRASVNLHNAMFQAITHATMRFFNTNPSGRILNRFSKDMGSIDEVLPQTMIDSLQVDLSLTAIVVMVSIVNFWLVLPTLVIGLVFYYLRIIYLSTSRNVKRLEGIARSPVFSHLNASLQGLATIRAFGAQNILIKEFDDFQDLHSSAWFMYIATCRAFGLWLDLFCFVYISLVTVSFLIIGNETFGGNVGLAITQSIGLMGMFQWGMRQSAEMENQMTSVERVVEYTNVEKEPPLASPPDSKPPIQWPVEGRIAFEKLFLYYNPDDPPVLKNLNFMVNSHEKVGIVGRTGAGKSSLIAALFRLTDLKGSITIDGLETTKTMGLHDLRSKISIIPQEPFIFSGTLRKNLDPFDEFPDSVLMKALKEVELMDAVEALDGGIIAVMSEGGSNLSVGQRQLVCLARAIIRNNKILVLDEATANVDPKMDAVIQKTIRDKFADCTVLTIAHRLHTVMDSDRVLVMDNGEVAEFDKPFTLLQNPNGLLFEMVQKTGKAMADTLRKVAEESYNQTKKHT